MVLIVNGKSSDYKLFTLEVLVIILKQYFLVFLKIVVFVFTVYWETLHHHLVNNVIGILTRMQGKTNLKKTIFYLS